MVAGIQTLPDPAGSDQVRPFLAAGGLAGGSSPAHGKLPWGFPAAAPDGATDAPGDVGMA